MPPRRQSPTSTASTQSNITIRTDTQADSCTMSSASPSISTPPTSLEDEEASVLSDTTQLEQPGDACDDASVLQTADKAQDTAHTTPGTDGNGGRRSARQLRKPVPTYNVRILSGTAVHTPTKYLEKHHKRVLHGSLEPVYTYTLAPAKKRLPKLNFTDPEIRDPAEEQIAAEIAQAARRRTSSRVTDLRKEALRNLHSAGDLAGSTKSGKKAVIPGTTRRSASDSHLSLAGPSSSASSTKRSRTTTQAKEEFQNEPVQEEEIYVKPKSKTWLKQGLYVGQHRDFDPRLSETQNRAKKRNKKTEENNALPFPIFAGERLLNEDPLETFRDYKLPFDVYNPLPKKVKVEGWVKLNKNRFIGNASALWKRDKQDSSQCYCDPEDGCGEACHNRIMAYECDSTNCRLPSDQCGNRPFAELRRRAKGNGYDYGVEVLDTEDRGYGVRAMRTFEPHQIIVEYAGEIITQSECERRMKHVYKHDKCYYLMSFDNKMIIDATRGTIARFVNHSCEPNCEMIKWTVGGEPRMALFAGPRGIMTGEELTYDYNFDPFSQKNIQECRCGTESCRGVLGPKPKKPVEEKHLSSTHIRGTKRKTQDLFGAGRVDSESRLQISKRLRMHGGNSITTKVTKAVAQSEAARKRAEREAREHSRQIASRENRALKRSRSGNGSGHSRSVILRAKQLPSVKLTRHTTVSFKRKVPKSGTLRVVKNSSNLPTARRRNTTMLNSKKGIRSSNRPRTPIREHDMAMSDSQEDNSPNITSACLRSASVKSRRIDAVHQARVGKRPLSRMGAEYVKTEHPFATSMAKAQPRKSSSASRNLQNTSDEDNNFYHYAQIRSRTTRGRFLPKGTA